LETLQGIEVTTQRVRLGVNIDHVATLRQQRGTRFPDPVFAASLAELGGADQITVHLREDRRHISDRDVHVLRKTVQIPLNLEMAATDEMVRIALETLPEMVTLVPEKRAERTTEGGLDVVGQAQALRPLLNQLRSAGILVSLFIDPVPEQVRMAATLQAQTIELHTGDYCEARAALSRSQELSKLDAACTLAHSLGLTVAAGHGLDYHNVQAVAELPYMEELNIGHAIVCRAVFVGLERAVRDMRLAMIGAI
jgi:pyridoxine 5-phosphate synthase